MEIRILRPHKQVFGSSVLNKHRQAQLLIVAHYQGRCTTVLQFGSFGLVIVSWELSSQSLAGLALGSKTRLVKST